RAVDERSLTDGALFRPAAADHVGRIAISRVPCRAGRIARRRPLPKRPLAPATDPRRRAHRGLRANRRSAGLDSAWRTAGGSSKRPAVGRPYRRRTLAHEAGGEILHVLFR